MSLTSTHIGPVAYEDAAAGAIKRRAWIESIYGAYGKASRSHHREWTRKEFAGSRGIIFLAGRRLAVRIGDGDWHLYQVDVSWDIDWRPDGMISEDFYAM